MNQLERRTHSDMTEYRVVLGTCRRDQQRRIFNRAALMGALFGTAIMIVVVIFAYASGDKPRPATPVCDQCWRA